MKILTYVVGFLVVGIAATLTMDIVTRVQASKKADSAPVEAIPVPAIGQN